MSLVEQTETIFPRPLSGHRVDPLPPALVPPRIVLSGTFVSLEPQNAERHAEELFNSSHSTPEGLAIWDYLTYGPWKSVEDYRSALRAQTASFDPVFYSIRSIKSGRACGQASFLDIHAANGVIEIGHIWFSPELQRTPGGTEALFLMLCHAMDDLGYRRMQWRCNALNGKSRAAALRLGFRFEGIFYNNLIFKGKNRDTAWYSILDDEWPEVRSKIAKWLEPSNFDGNDQSKASLSDAMKSRSKSTRRPSTGD